MTAVQAEPLALHEERFFDPDPAIAVGRPRALRGDAWAPADLPARPRRPVAPGRGRAVSGADVAPDRSGSLHLPDAVLPAGSPWSRSAFRRATASSVETDPRKIWQRFADHYYLFRGTPTGAWLDHELHDLFGVRVKLDGDTAQHVYDQIAERLASPEFRPRALFERFNIEVLATTDKASDCLDAHSAIRESGWSGRVIPTFRPDAVFRIATPAWRDELTALSTACGQPIVDYRGVRRRARGSPPLLLLARRDARPTTASSSRTPSGSRRAEADALFRRALQGAATPADQREFEAHMLVEMARMSVSDGLVMQLHAGALRDHNPLVFERFGPDKGADIPVQTEYTRNLAPLLNAYGNDPRLTLRAVHARRVDLHARARAARRPLSGGAPRAGVVVPRFDRGHDALSPAGDGDGRHLQHGRIQRRHARVLLDSRRVTTSRVASTRTSSAVWSPGTVSIMSDARVMARALAYDLAKETYRL